MTNQEMLIAAIEFEEVEFSYDLMYLIQTGALDANAEYDRPDWNRVDKAVVNEWQQQNLLGFDLVNLYAVRINVSDFMIIMAKDDASARGYALNKLGPGNYKIQKMPHHKWLTEFWFDDTKEFKSLIDIKKETAKFPTHLII